VVALFNRLDKTASSSRRYPTRRLTCDTGLATPRPPVETAFISASYDLPCQYRFSDRDRTLTFRNLQLSMFNPRNVRTILTFWFLMGMPTKDTRASTMSPEWKSFGWILCDVSLCRVWKIKSYGWVFPSACATKSTRFSSQWNICWGSCRPNTAKSSTPGWNGMAGKPDAWRRSVKYLPSTWFAVNDTSAGPIHSPIFSMDSCMAFEKNVLHGKYGIAVDSSDELCRYRFHCGDILFENLRA